MSLNGPHDLHYPLGACANSAMFMDLMVHGTLRLTLLCIKVSVHPSLYKDVHSKGKMPTINYYNYEQVTPPILSGSAFPDLYSFVKESVTFAKMGALPQTLLYVCMNFHAYFFCFEGFNYRVF